MAARRVLLSAAFSFAVSASILPPSVQAQDAAGQEENAKQPFIGQINGNAVFVRSAAREDAYPVTRLEKGAQVTVVGIKFKWLKILPPEGSFAYVPKAYIDRRGDGNIGRASRELIAKVGSDLMEFKTAPMAKVDQGKDVQIIGEKDEYYKIKPPEGSYLYVAQQFVDPVKPVAVADGKVVPQPGPAVKPNPAQPKTTTGGVAQGVVNGLTENHRLPSPPSTQPVGTPGNVAEAATPSTQPSSEAALAASNTFDQLETDFKAANEKPINDQPLAQLSTSYTDLLKQDSLPASMRRVAEIRVATLKLRSEAKDEFLATRAQQEKAMERRKALEAERDEIQERIKRNELTIYAAVGTLRASSVQRGAGMLYRLTDPASGRTVAYLRTSDTKYAALIGQFVGVKGVIGTDSALNMKMIDQPTETVAVDPAKVNKSVTAQIIPPSLMAGIRSASTGE